MYCGRSDGIFKYSWIEKAFYQKELMSIQLVRNSHVIHIPTTPLLCLVDSRHCRDFNYFSTIIQKK